MTKKKAKKTIEEYRDLTGFFDSSMSETEMYEMLRYRMRFGEAETRVIMSSLVVCGAKFRNE